MPLPPRSPATARTAPARIARRAFTSLVTALLAGCVPATESAWGVEALSTPAPSQVPDNCYADPGPLPFVAPPQAARVVEPGGSYPTVQSAVDAARPGDVILVRPGVYRESVTIRKSNLTLWGLPGAVISGANRLEGWTKDAQGAWSVAYSAPGSSGGQCRDGVNCGSNLSLYRDGRALKRVSSTPGAGDYVYRNGRLELGASPAGHVFEVPARAYWIKAEKADNIVIRGLTFRVAVPPAQRGGLENNGGNNWVIQGNDLAFSHASGAYLDGENVQFTGNRVHENGQEGVASGFSRGLKVN
ncbi:MAG TPA: hypothetical protein VHN99_11970, partial [Deinococcales bacterium]|nr:hypothetical protein [Deinococcales bacterium]